MEAQVEALEQQLRQRRQKSAGCIEVNDPTFLDQFLDDEYQELPELIRAVVESRVLDDLIRKSVEDQLYFFASQRKVEHELGWSWNHSESED